MPLFFGNRRQPQPEIALRTREQPAPAGALAATKRTAMLPAGLQCRADETVLPGPGTTTEVIIYCFTLPLVRSYIYFFSG